MGSSRRTNCCAGGPAKCWLSEAINKVTQLHSMAWRYGMIRFFALDRLDERNWHFILPVTGRQIGIGLVVGNCATIFRITKRGVDKLSDYIYDGGLRTFRQRNDEIELWEIIPFRFAMRISARD